MHNARLTQLHFPRIAIAVCALLLAIFATTSWLAVRTKSPTFDEPYHALSAWTHLHQIDFRIDCEDPPLWKYWLALPNGSAALLADFNSKQWVDQPQTMWMQWTWCANTLYKTPGNNAEAFVMRSRAMMLVLAVALGAMISWWSWKIGGAVASIVATTLFCFDPNFLAHSALVKNDVAFSLAMLALVYALWRAGQKLSWLGALWIAILCGIALTVKFSGVFAVLLVPLLLGLRAIMPQPWLALGRTRLTRLSRLIVAGDLTLLSLLGGFAIIWLAYGLRFSPTPDPAVRLNILEIEQMATANEMILRNGGGQPTQEQVALVHPGWVVSEVMSMESHHVLPQAWLAGFLFTYQSSLLRISYLCGHVSRMGWWWYFPFAILVKTPLTTLAAFIGAASLGIITIIIPRRNLWTAASLAVPALLYTAIAMHSNLNIGIRHILPVYPLAFIAVGGIAAYAWRQWPRGTTWVVTIGALLLTTESLSAFPNFIPFFNRVAGGSSGGFYLLGDSNLDWGQDLKLLKKWQQAHPQVPLYLSYFGMADPHYYGIEYHSLPGGYHYDANHEWPDRPCKLAVSATNLQGVFIFSNRSSDWYRALARQTPSEILGGTIYLYDYP